MKKTHPDLCIKTINGVKKVFVVTPNGERETSFRFGGRWALPGEYLLRNDTTVRIVRGTVEGKVLHVRGYSDVDLTSGPHEL